MSKTVLRVQEPITLPVEADSISPDQFAGLTHAQVMALPVLKGRRKVSLGDLFLVEGDGAAEIELVGDLSHVKRIGQNMTGGKIIISGNVGMHLGSGMRGGEIEVQGDVGAWAGAQMAGGLLRVHGSADAKLGAGYTGARLGMRGGVIIVDGNVAQRAGERMRRGLIVVAGDAGEFTGTRMIAGSIFVFGKLGGRAGAGMKRGTIVALGGLADHLLPTFNYACEYRPVFMRFYLLRLREWGLPVTVEHIDGPYRRFTGDVNALGKGEVLIHG